MGPDIKRKLSAEESALLKDRVSCHHWFLSVLWKMFELAGCGCRLFLKSWPVLLPDGIYVRITFGGRDMEGNCRARGLFYEDTRGKDHRC